MPRNEGIAAAVSDSCEPSCWFSAGELRRIVVVCDSIDVEVGVEAEDFAMALVFGERYQCGVGEVHGSVRILVHQLRRSLDRCGGQLSKEQAAGMHQSPEGALTGDAARLGLAGTSLR